MYDNLKTSVNISPLRISQWVVDKMTNDADTPLKQLLYGDGLLPEQLEALYKIKLLVLRGRAEVRNITELYAETDTYSALRYCCYDADSLLTSVVKQVTSLFSGKNLTISLECSETCKNVIFDLRRTSLVLYNLLSNAIIHSGKKEKKISVEAFMRGDDFVISVTDNGKALPKSARDNLFTAFEASLMQISDDTLSLKGLGLSVCRKAARDMGGDTVYVPSSKYNRFEFYIPQNNKPHTISETSVCIPDPNEIELYLAEALLSI